MDSGSQVAIPAHAGRQQRFLSPAPAIPSVLPFTGAGAPPRGPRLPPPDRRWNRVPDSEAASDLWLPWHLSHLRIGRAGALERLDLPSYFRFPWPQNYIFDAFNPPRDIFITFSDERTRKQVQIQKDNRKTVMVPAFQSLETIAGEVSITPVLGKRLEHTGVKIELLGQTVRELDVPGEIYERKTYPFEFSTIEMPYESYNGTNVRLRYILKVTIGRSYVGSIVERRDFCVRNYSPVPTINNSIKMEVGIEDCLHIEFEYSKSMYHLKDVIIGKIYFLLVRIKIKNMELEIRSCESTRSGYVQTETLAKFELMDGAPVRGESIPVRLFLTPYEITPTYQNINNMFSVKYYLNLVLVDEEDRRYFKQQEMTMYRLLETPQST